MNSIRRLLSEDQDCFAPVLASALSRPRSSKEKPKSDRQKKDSPGLSKEKVVESLVDIASSLESGPLALYGPHILKLAESINKGSLIPFDAEITSSTTLTTDVVVKPIPPENDSVIASILGKEAPKMARRPLEVVQAEKNQQNNSSIDSAPAPAQAGPPSPAEVQRAMEDAMLGRDTGPKMELVESSDMSSAMSMLKMESFSGPVGVPLMGQPTAGRSDKVWGAFKKFVKK